MTKTLIYKDVDKETRKDCRVFHIKDNLYHHFNRYRMKHHEQILVFPNRIELFKHDLDVKKDLPFLSFEREDVLERFEYGQFLYNHFDNKP